MKQFFNSLRHGFRGIGTTFVSERNFRLHVTASVLVIVFGFIFAISLVEWIAVIFAMGLIMAAEAFNTAIEKLADRVESKPDPAIGAVKDAAAAGVLITAIAAGAVGIIVFAPELWNWLNLLLETKN